MINNSLWREVGEREKEGIEEDSKKLLNEFALKLSKIKADDKHFENNSGMRDEGDGWNTDAEFRSIILSNAPFVDGSFIVAEKGEWKNG